MRGVALKAVQELLGHATIDMTMRYAHLSPEVKREAVRLLDDLPPRTPSPVPSPPAFALMIPRI
jgi:integrase